jgi:hypothetical protein
LDADAISRAASPISAATAGDVKKSIGPVQKQNYPKRKGKERESRRPSPKPSKNAAWPSVPIAFTFAAVQNRAMRK